MNLFPLTQTASLVGQLMDTRASTVPLIEMTSFKPRYNFGINSTPLPRCTPEEEGIPSSLILDLIQKLSRDKSVKLHSITIARNGRIICEAAIGAQRLDVWKHSFSACKSVTSLAIGMLIDDGLLTLDEKVVDIFKEESSPIAKLKLKDLCIEDLLTMRSTVLFAEGDSMTDDDWVKSFLASPTKGIIGETFRYNSLNTYILSAVVTKKTGKTLSDFLKDRLFTPLGIEDYYWEKCPKGIDKGGWGLYIRPEDFIKIGMLVINGGVYDSKRIVSEEYVTLATSKHVDISAESERYDYGYQIWVGKNNDSFLFNGMLGQNLLGFKRNGIVVLANAGNSEMFQQGNFFKYMDEAFDRDFLPYTSPAQSSYNELSGFIKSLSLYTEKAAKKNFLRSFFGPKDTLLVHMSYFDRKNFCVSDGDNKSIGILPLVIQSVENCYSRGFEGISFVYSRDNKPLMIYRETDAEFVFPLGFDEPEIFNLEYRNDNFLVASSAKFATNEDGDEVFVIRLDFLETPSTRIIKIYKEDDEHIRMVQSESPGEDFMFRLSEMFMSEIAEKPIIGAMLDKFGKDYLEYRIDKIFNTDVILSTKK